MPFFTIDDEYSNQGLLLDIIILLTLCDYIIGEPS